MRRITTPGGICPTPGRFVGHTGSTVPEVRDKNGLSSLTVKQIIFIVHQGTVPQTFLSLPNESHIRGHTRQEPFYISSRFPFLSLYTTHSSMVSMSTQLQPKKVPSTVHTISQVFSINHSLSKSSTIGFTAKII